MNLFFYVAQKKFWGATEHQFDPKNLDLWLESPNQLLNSINSGEWIWVATHIPNDRYILVSKLCVLTPRDTTTNTYGDYRITGDPKQTVLYDQHGQPDLQQLVGQLRFRLQSTVLFRETFEGLDHLRELTSSDHQLLEQWAQQHLTVI